MPLLHISLNQADKKRNVNQWNVGLSHTIAPQELTLKSCSIHTVGKTGVIEVSGVATAGDSGKNCLLLHMESGDGNCLEERQIVSNVLGGSWFPIPCNYEADRTNNQIYTGLDLPVESSGYPHNIIVTILSDILNGSNPLHPSFGGGANQIDKIDLLFEYSDFEKAFNGQ
jgi:hypothetical protein